MTSWVSRHRWLLAPAAALVAVAVAAAAGIAATRSSPPPRDPVRAQVATAAATLASDFEKTAPLLDTTFVRNFTGTMPDGQLSGTVAKTGERACWGFTVTVNPDWVQTGDPGGVTVGPVVEAPAGWCVPSTGL